MENKGEKIQKVFRKGDFFGVSPKFFIDSHTQYKTVFGASLSFLLFLVVIGACWVYGKDIYYKENPNSILTEEGTTHQEKFEINKNTLNFGFMLTDIDFVPFSDPTIYTYKLQEKKMTITKNSQGEEVTDISFRDLKPRPCKISDFGVATDYFEKLIWLETLWCMDEPETEIEGDFGSDTFTMVQGLVYPCRNSTDTEVICKPQEVIDSTLKDTYWSVTTSDYVLDPKNYDNPFKAVGRDVYGFTSGDMFRLTDINFRNVYINDNTGVIFDQWSYKKGLQYSNIHTIVKTSPLDDGCFFQFNIRFEKVKQSRLFRTYLNLAQVLANVGGVLKVVMLTFAIISAFVSSKFYHLAVANSLFQFQNDDNNNSDAGGGGGDKKISKNQKKKNNLEDSSSQQKNNKLHFKHFFHSFTTLFSQKDEKLQKEMLDFSISKLSYHLDIRRILQKLIEIDRLKALLLNDQQRQLFEYLPKPVINEQMVSRQFLKNQEQNRQSLKIRHEKHKDINLLFEDIRTDNEKQKDAFTAYQYIQQLNKKSKVDFKILQIMDENLRQEFDSKITIKKEDIIENNNHFLKNQNSNLMAQNSSCFKDSQAMLVKDNSHIDINSFTEGNNSRLQVQNQFIKEEEFGPVSEEFRDYSTIDITKHEKLRTFSGQHSQTLDPKTFQRISTPQLSVQNSLQPSGRIEVPILQKAKQNSIQSQFSLTNNESLKNFNKDTNFNSSTKNENYTDNQ